jgi:opacity protein-like surface antigen
MYRASSSSRVLLCLAMLLCGFAPAAWAQGGFYLAATGGKAFFADDPFTGAISGDITQSFSGEFAVGGAVGYAFSGKPLQLEVEFSAFFADVDDLRNTQSTFVGGSDRHLASMVNFCYRGRVGGRTRPYLGVGLGLDVEKWGLQLITPAGVSTAGRYDTRSFFAYQFKAGVERAVATHLGVAGGYRYFRTQTRELDSPSSQTPYPHSAQGIHLLEVGLRWQWE